MKKRPKVDPDSWYSLTEAARATGIRRGQLDHACRDGCLPYRRDGNGYRLLSGKIVDQLARDGDFRSYPRPYEHPPGPAPGEGYQDQPTSTDGGPGPSRQPSPTPAEKLGLLDRPSPEMVKAKEETERARLEAERLEANLKAATAKAELADFWRKRRRARQEEAEAEQESMRAEREEEARRRRQLEEQQRARRRQEAWVKQQVDLALEACQSDFGLLGSVPSDRKREARTKLGHELSKHLAVLGPDSSRAECERARERAITCALSPYRWEKLRRDVFDRCWFRDPVEQHIEKLYDKGFLDLPQPQRVILANEIRPKVIEALHQEFIRRGQMQEGEASALLPGIVERLI